MLNITNHTFIFIIHIQILHFSWRKDKNIVIDTSRINAYVLFKRFFFFITICKIITFRVGLFSAERLVSVAICSSANEKPTTKRTEFSFSNALEYNRINS